MWLLWAYSDSPGCEKFKDTKTISVAPIYSDLYCQVNRWFAALVWEYNFQEFMFWTKLKWGIWLVTKNKHIQSQLVQKEPYGTENCNIVSFHRDLQGFTISTGDIQRAQCAGDTYLYVAHFWWDMCLWSIHEHVGSFWCSIGWAHQILPKQKIWCW